MQSSKPNKIAPIRLLAVAPSQYGKTYAVVHWLCKLIRQKEWHPKRVIIISPTAKTDDSMEPLISLCESKCPNFKETNMYEYVDEGMLLSLYDIQKEIKEHNPAKLKQFLVIIDDSITDDAMHRKSSPLLKISTSGRHFGISTCVMMQQYRSSSNPLIRSQTSCMLLGRLNNLSQVEDIATEFSTGLGKTKKEAVARFLELAENCWASNDQHGFIVIWPYKQYGTGRL